MAPCTATNCKKREEELLANQMEQRRLLTSQVVTHAAKVATANTNLLKGILESFGGEGEALSEEVSLAVISTLKAEIDAKKRAIVQSNSNLQQRERMFSHPLNDNRSMMSVGELHEWRGVHRRLEVVEGRRVKELEKDIIRVALGRDMEVAGGGNSVEDQESSLGISEELLRRKPTIEEEEVLTDIEMESPDDEEISDQEASCDQMVDNPNTEVESEEETVNLNKEALNLQSESPLKDNMNSDKVAEGTVPIENMVEEVGAEVMGNAEDSGEVVGEIRTSSIPAQTPQLANTVESPSLQCKDCTKTFSTTDSLMAHTKIKHLVHGSRCQPCPLRGCSYVAMKGGLRKLMSHSKEKHTPLARNCNNNDLQRQDWPQVPSKSTENLCAGMQDADAETARGDIQRPRGRGRPRGGSATVSSVSSKVIMKKMGTRSCIAGKHVEVVMKRSKRALAVICKGDGDCAGVTTRSKEQMVLRSKSLRK